jgi:hypothetical protein
MPLKIIIAQEVQRTSISVVRHSAKEFPIQLGLPKLHAKQTELSLLLSIGSMVNHCLLAMILCLFKTLNI